MSTTTSLSYVYDGRRCIGHVIGRGKTGFEGSAPTTNRWICFPAQRKRQTHAAPWRKCHEDLTAVDGRRHNRRMEMTIKNIEVVGVDVDPLAANLGCNGRGIDLYVNTRRNQRQDR